MASGSLTELQGDDLSETTLYLYLKDPNFVEYFNAFLLLPAFSSRLFFNSDTGLFEQVHGEAVQAWSGDGRITSSTSLATLYLTDEVVGPSVDKQQSWQWVTQHRLPLFLKSDLFSEYKLCKLLTAPATDHSNGISRINVVDDIDTPSMKPQKSKSATKLPTNKKPHPLSKSSLSSSAMFLPSVNTKESTSTSDGSSPSMVGHRHIVTSKSDIELGSKGHTISVTTSSRQPELQKRQTQVNISADVPCIVLGEDSVDLPERKGGRPTGKGSVKMTARDLTYLGTKSGMNSLWKFLKGTMGERNWLFWLDAEHVKYSSKHVDQQRLLREIRERYLHSGSPLELPTETRNKLRVSKASRLTLAQVKELQLFMLQGLREYWCPRFILHCHSEEESLSPQQLQHPSLPSSRSTTPMCFQRYTTSSNNTHSEYPNRPSPFTPSRTPTFKRVALSPHRRSKSSPMIRKSQGDANSPATRDNVKVRQVAAGNDDVGAAKDHENLRPHTVAGGRLMAGLLAKSLANGKEHSRKVWDGSRKTRTSLKMTSPARNIKKAKYTSIPLIDPNSRCSSSMDLPDPHGMCASRCQILSVAGTPLHSTTSLPQHCLTYTNETYTSLLLCLHMEQRKAGGYFQNHLEALENKTFLHCLLFWCEVQQYKTLFDGSSFSPCAVEKKAKALFGCYVCDGCDKDIDCPARLASSVSSNLWPAYEDLFDAVEEHSLSMLLIPWLELCSSEDRIFQELEVLSRHGSLIIGQEDLDEEEIYDDVDGCHKLHSRSQSSAKASRLMSHIDMPGSLRASSSQLGDASQATSLNDIIKNRVEFEHFKVFLNEHFAAQDLMCWMEIEAFRGIPASDKTMRDIKAKQLRSTYFTKKYFFGPNSPATKEQQRQTVQAGGGGYGCRLPARPRTPVFREAQKHVRRRLEKKWLAEFIASPDFISRNGGSLLKDANRGRRVSVNGQSQSFIYERTFANSHEAILFRKTLQDKVQRRLLLRYLSIKQTANTSSLLSFSKQNIEFWLEVQRYKEMCHFHTTDSMLQNKVNAIIDCYFQSSTPPKVQLSIPLNVAEELTSRPHGPYIFRVAQAAVFKHLYTCWEEYRNFTSGYYTPEEVERALDELQRQILESLAAQREQENRASKEQAELRMAMPRFETEAEKEERLRMEKELAEFGEVSEAFRLSKPNPRYTYYTDLPEDFYTEEMRMLRQKAFDGIAEVEPSTEKKQSPCEGDKISAKVEPQRTKHDCSRVQNQQKCPKLPREDNCETPVIFMKMERSSNKLVVKDKQQNEEPVTVSFEQEVTARLPLKPEVSHQQFLLERQTSRNFFRLKRANSRLIKRQTRKKLPDFKYAPHSTINMRLSDGPRTFELYGGGLPPEQSSHLKIVSVATS